MRLTLQEVAAYYKVSPKTFAKIAAAKHIPFERLGRSKRFDLAVVSAHLTEVPKERRESVLKFPVRKQQTKFSSKLAKAVGL